VNITIVGNVAMSIAHCCAHRERRNSDDAVCPVHFKFSVKVVATARRILVGRARSRRDLRLFIGLHATVTCVQNVGIWCARGWLFILFIPRRALPA